MRSWMRYSMYIISLILVALIVLPSLAVGKPPEDKGKDKDNGKPPQAKDEVKFVIITSSSGPNGNVSPSGSVKVKIGDDQRFEISANGGYRIKEVLLGDDSVFSCDSEANNHVRKWEYTIKDVQKSQDIYAEFERDVFTIKALARGPGTISPPGAVKVSYEGSQDFTIRATRGFCIDDVQISPSDDKNNLDMDLAKDASAYTFSFNGVTSDYTIIVTFARLKELEPDPETDPETLTIESEAEGGGSIDPSGEVEVEYGSNQTFTMTPDDSCHRIAVVEVDGEEVVVDIGAGTGEVKYTFSNVTSNHTIHATFEEITYTITASAEGGGSIGPSDKVEVACGSEQVSFTITPGDLCHRIAMVEVDGEEVGVDIDEGTGEVKYTFYNVTSDHTIHATFEEITYTITASAEGGGSIEPPDKVEVACGSEQVSFTITPGEPCHRIAVVEVDGEGVDVDIDEGTGEVKYTFYNVTSDHTIHATFEEITEPYIITASAEGGGSIGPSDKVEVACGSEQVSFTITPGDPCHRIAMVEVDGEEVGVDIDKGTGKVTYTFYNVTSDHTIHATFEEVTEPYTITASAGDFGSIEPSGEVKVACGSEQVSFTITPAEPCYGIAVVEVDGVPVDAGIDEATGEVKYTFTSVASDHSIHATFKKTTYTIKTVVEGNGSIEPSGDVQVECGGSQLFKIKPDEGYTRGSVFVDEELVKTKGNKYEFTDVHSDHTIKVTFVEDLDEDDLIGDVNNDGKVNSGDAIFILLIVTGQIEPTEQQRLAADVNGDGVIDVNDALFVLNIVAGLAAPDANVDNALLQNFPNPFNPETWIPFSLSEGSEVTIEIYDATGHLLRRLPLGRKSAGSYTSQERAAYWDGCNEDGERVASGVYFYAIRAGNFADVKKMIIAQ